MQRFMSTKRIVVLAVAAVAIVASVAAYAYFSASGSGTGTASIGSTSAISLSGSVSGALYPAGAAASVSVVATNTGSGSQYVNTIHLAGIQIDHSSPTYTGASGSQQTTWDTSCDLSSSGGNPAFTLADISVAATLTKSGTAGDHVTKTGSLQMN